MGHIFHPIRTYARFLLAGCAWCAVLLLPVWSGAQNCHIHIFGHVRDTTSSDPIPYANILIQETGHGALADEQGYFHIEGLCPGEYTVRATRIGCTDYEQRIQIRVDTGILIRMQQTSLELGKVEVRAGKIALAQAQATQTLEGIAFETGKGLGLAESLKNIPGVSSLNTGATISKPIIQGLHSNRIVIINNGVRQEGQQWGSEHAPEIDPFTAQEVTVIKGAGSVRYGADALGGIILLNPAPLRETAGMNGELQLQGMSNGRTGIVSGMLETRLNPSKLPLAGRIQGTLKRGGNLHTPDYFLQNTGVSEYNFSWTARLDRPNWYSEAYYSRFYAETGILRDAHIGNVTDLQNAIQRGRPLEDGAFTYTLGRPQQRALHELVRWTTQHNLGEHHKLNVQFSRQFNRRQEYDAHRRFNVLPAQLDAPQIALEITTYRAEVDLEHHWFKHLSGHTGVNAMTQRNTTDKGGLLPDYTNQLLGVYWTEHWKNYPNPLELELGVRYDIQSLSAGPFDKEPLNLQRNFQNFSGSAGAIYSFSQRTRLRLNIGTAWRAPHVSELYSAGVHHGSASYEEGNPNLQAERAWNNSLTFEWATPEDRYTLFISGYYNLIQDFIYLKPMSAPVLTIRGAFPGFTYAQTDARLTGIDTRFTMHPGVRWAIEAQAALLQSWNRTQQDYIIFMPPNQFRYSLRYSLNLEAKPCPERYVQLSAIQVLRQRWAPQDQDFTTPPAGYLRFDAEAAYTLHIGKQHIELGLSVRNMLDIRYRDYLNRLRYFAEEPGRNILFRVRLPIGL